MAYYHVGKCDCPMGCCFCGPSRDSDLAVIYDPEKNEIYTWDVTGSCERVDYLCDQWGHVYLGMLDERVL